MCIRDRPRPCYGRVDGRFRPCRWLVHGRVHGPCTRGHAYAAVYVSCARPVHGRVHVPCNGAVYAPCARPKTSVKMAVHSHIRGWCRRITVVPYTRPIHGRVRAVFAGEDVFTDGLCTRPPCNGHTTRYTTVYTARTRPHNGRRPWTTRTRACNCRVDIPCTPYTWRCNVCVHVSPAHGPCTRTWTGRVDGPCIRLPTWALRLHGPYTAIIPRQDNTRFIQFTCIIFHL